MRMIITHVSLYKGIKRSDSVLEKRRCVALTEEHRPTAFENKDVTIMKHIFLLTKEEHRPRTFEKKKYD
jgi:hypothetical protein